MTLSIWCMQAHPACTELIPQCPSLCMIMWDHPLSLYAAVKIKRIDGPHLQPLI